MDFGKIPIDKVMYFVAGLVPGATAVYIYYLSNPDAFHDFLTPGVFGYRTKLAILVGFCFIVGNTITKFAYVVAGMFWGGLWGGLSAYMQRKSQQILTSAPWREPSWRKLAVKYLGDSAPNNTVPISDDEFNKQTAALALLPAEERAAKEGELRDLRVRFLLDDSSWSQWYAQINDQMRTEMRHDFMSTFAQGIGANVQATAAYMAGALFFVPALRNWMCITFVAGWLWIIFAEGYTAYVGGANPWSTWLPQREYLAKMTLSASPKGKPESDDDEDSSQP